MTAFFLFKDQNCHFITIQNTIPKYQVLTKYRPRSDNRQRLVSTLNCSAHAQYICVHAHIHKIIPQ